MITRTVRLQLVIFAVITLLGTSYVGLRYVGLADTVLGNTYVVNAEFSTSGGVFTNASVTYRGVPVGRVGELRPTRGGVVVELRLERGIDIPRDLRAVTTNRSAIGEQHIDLRPNTESGPYLKPGDVIPNDRTGIPLPVERLIFHIDSLAQSVDPDDLAVVIDELGKAFEGNEEALGRLLDASDLLLEDARKHLPETIALIRDGRTVLETQELTGDAIRRWAAGLAKLSRTFADADPDLRRVLANAPPAANEVITLYQDLEPNIGMLLGNLITVNGIQARRIENLRGLFVGLPLVVGGSFTVAPGDGMAHLGLVLNSDDPPPCVYRPNNDPDSPRSKPGSEDFAKCTDEELEGEGNHPPSSVRGWQNIPERPGPEISPAPLGGEDPPQGHEGDSDSNSHSDSKSDSRTRSTGSEAAVASYDPATGLILGPTGQPLQLGITGGQYALLGEESWKELLYAGVAG